MEALGAAAACLQLLEVAGQTLLLLSKLYTRAKDAPQFIQRIDRQLEQLVTLATLLQPHLDQCALTGNNPCVLETIKAVLTECVVQAEQLSRRLVTYTQGDSLWKKGWHTIKALNREEQIKSISLHLEHHKSTLALWLAAANHAALGRIEASILNVNFDQSTLVGSDTDQNTDTLDMQTKRLRKSYSAYERAAEPTTPQDQNGSIKRPTKSRWSSVTCTCAARHTISTGSIARFIHFRTSKIEHEPSCPCADIVERKFFIPNSYFNYAVNGSFVTYTINGRSSLNQNLSCNRIVNESDSPAFQIFTKFYAAQTSEPKERKLLENSKAIFDTEHAIESLSHTFRTGQASPWDVNQYGQTLMTACLQFFWTMFQHNLLKNYNDVAKTVRFLTDAGVPVNEHGIHEGSPVGLISRLEENLMSQDIMNGDSKRLLLVKHFLAAGGDYEEDDDFVQFRGGYNLGCALFSTLPEFMEAANISQVHIAVMTADLDRLEQLIQSGADLDQVNTWGSAPILYARQNAPALKMLLDAGADPNPVNKGCWNALSGAAAWYNYDAVSTLLDADAAIIGLRELFSTLATREISMQTRVLEVMANRRSRLRQFAVWRLTDPKWKHLDLGQVRPLDSKAVEVARALEITGVDIPSSLLVYWNKGDTQIDNPEPTFVQAIIQGSAYHLEPVQIETAQLLAFLDNIFAAGFHEVDAHGSRGLTPLLICSVRGQWEIATWLLERISGPPNTMTSYTLNALHCVAFHLGEAFDPEVPEPSSHISDFLHRLQKAGVQADQGIVPSGEEGAWDCRCCPEGQTPTVVLTKLIVSSMAKNESLRGRSSSVTEEALHKILAIWEAALPHSEVAMETIYRCLARQQVFQHLEMTHTCLDLSRVMENIAPSSVIEVNEVHDIRIEDGDLKEKLEKLMQQYEAGRVEYVGNAWDFNRDWVAGLH